MALHVKDAGGWKTPKDLWVKTGGVWTPVRRAFVRDGGTWKQTFQDEVVAIVGSHSAQISAQSFFSPADWSNPILNKRLVVAAGIHVWSYTPGTPALNVGSGRGGKLVIENNGYILGAGGYNNGGTGGDAIYVGQSGVSIINNLAIYGGGGGGGVGGQGGSGYFQTPYTLREPSSGEYFDPFAYFYGKGGAPVAWAGSNLGTNNNQDDVWYGGSYLYYPGSLQSGTPGGYATYGIYRTSTAYSTTYTSGGAGGTGGRGTGYDGGLSNVYQNGFGGAGGGTNAGTGGTGGNGGGWGAAGATGNTGASGNNGGGSGGGGGGAAGYYIYGLGNLDTFVNNNAVLGRVA